jgi:hypothetical protein
MLETRKLVIQEITCFVAPLRDSMYRNTSESAKTSATCSLGSFSSFRLRSFVEQ